jgi:hypothetical protein
MITPITHGIGIVERARAEQEQYSLTPADGVELSCDRYSAIMRLLEAINDVGSQDLYSDAEEYRNRVTGMQHLVSFAGGIRRGKTVTVAEIDGVVNGAFDDQERSL